MLHLLDFKVFKILKIGQGGSPLSPDEGPKPEPSMCYFFPLYFLIFGKDKGSTTIVSTSSPVTRDSIFVAG